MKNLLKYLPVAFVLIGLPIFSWYFLNKGTVMRKDAMKSLYVKSDLGQFQTVTDDDSTFQSSAMLGKRWFVVFIPETADFTQAMQISSQIYSQAKDDFSPYVLCISGIKSGISTIEISQNFQKKFDRKFCKNAFLAQDHFAKLGSQIFKIPENLVQKSLVILVDEKSKIRNYYELENENEVKKLVREYPVFLSLKP
jgi:hypothetical protein